MYHLTVIQDSRERTPLRFPAHIKVHLRRSKTPTLIKITTEVDTLPAGDYTIKGFDNVVLIETKRSARELHDNLLTADYRRASCALERLATTTKKPIFVCEFGQADLLSFGDSSQCSDALVWAVANYGLSVWFTGPRSGSDARRRTAEVVLRLMIACVELDYPNLLHGVSDEQHGPRKRRICGKETPLFICKRLRRTRTVCKRGRS